MISAVSAPVVAQVDDKHDRISLPRLVWVAPLTLVVALAVCVSIRFIVQALDPTLTRMPQLREPMIVLTVEGVLAAVVVFALFAAVVPKPIFWYRTLGAVALLVSFLPDIALAVGGAPMQLSMSVVGPLTSIGQSGPGPGGPGPGPGFGPGGLGGPGGPGGFTTPIEQVLVLMLLHVSVAMVCIVLLTTLTRKRATLAVTQS